jgi:hypothetical protein
MRVVYLASQAVGYTEYLLMHSTTGKTILSEAGLYSADG